MWRVAKNSGYFLEEPVDKLRYLGETDKNNCFFCTIWRGGFREKMVAL